MGGRAPTGPRRSRHLASAGSAATDGRAHHAAAAYGARRAAALRPDQTPPLDGKEIAAGTWQDRY